MTREQAEEMVDDRIPARHDYDTLGKKSYQRDYFAQKERVIAALMCKRPAVTGIAAGG